MATAMTSVLAFVAVLTALGLLAVLGAAMARAYIRSRGKRLILCPQARVFAAVDVDAPHAALTAASGRPEVRLRDCSLWPDRQGCAQDCLKQINEAPDGCAVRAHVGSYYKGKSCVFCHRPIPPFHTVQHEPALLNGQGVAVPWHQIQPEQLPQTLATHLPVCWDCYIVETFRRVHPELVIENPLNRNTAVRKTAQEPLGRQADQAAPMVRSSPC
jgi:hypothetical protein